MKRICFPWLIIIFFFACRNDTAHTLPGMYVSNSVNEFATVADSLLIEPGAHADEYFISRRMLIIYKQVNERSPQYRTDQWTALYDNKTKTLEVRDNGKMLFLNEENNGVQIGKTLYKKIVYEKTMDDRVARYR